MATATISDDGTWKTEADIPEKERYGRYLASREWGLLREQIKQRSGGICERCGFNKSDAVHHLTYERKYKERLEDLQDICEGCHKFTHGKSDEDPRGTAVVISGVFESRSSIFVFFDDGSCLPESEIYLRWWSWDAGDLFRFLGVDLPENPFARARTSLKALLGRKYWVRLAPNKEGNCISEIRQRTEEGTDADEFFHPRNSFAFSICPLVDAS